MPKETIFPRPMPGQKSHACFIASLPEPERKRFLEELSDDAIKQLPYTWAFWARYEQWAPSVLFRLWLVIAGRGFGKTRCGAEFVREKVEDEDAKRIALVGRTAADVRDVMVEGESGILAISPPDFRPDYEPSKRRLTWLNGAVATTYSADEPNLLRGPQHDLAWCDELAAWNHARDAWDQLMFGLRLGDNPQCVVTTTPRPTSLIRELMASKTAVVTRGSTYDNRENLAPGFFDDIVSKYEGTTIGRQEIHAEVFDQMPGALWTRDTIEKNRVTKHPELTRIVVAIDPAVTSKESSDETGIIVAGRGVDGHGYVLEDCTLRGSPDTWARRAIDAYGRMQADRIVAEVNNGGDLVETVLRTIDKRVSYSAVRASRGKRARAEPIAALDEQGKIHHVGMFNELEDQMCTWVSNSNDPSPDRMDARTWAMTELMLQGPSIVAPSVGLEMGDRWA